LAYGLFSALVASASARKGLLFEVEGAAPPPAAEVKGGKDAKGAPPAGQIDAAQLPARVALDILNCLKRQGSDKEGDLAYSATAVQEAQKSLPSKTIIKHAFALRRECDVFGSMYHAERRLSDSLHVALSQASQEYVQRKVLDEASVTALATPSAEAPTNGELLVHWARPDVGSMARLPSEHRAFFLFLCPPPAAAGAEGSAAKPMVARCNDVSLAGLRQLADVLSADLAHCRPAAAVSAAYVGQRFRKLAQVLRGAGRDADAVAAGADAALDAALAKLLLGLSSEAAGQEGEGVAPELLDAAKVQELLRAVLQLLDHSADASKVVHLPLSSFLRAAVAPLRCLPT